MLYPRWADGDMNGLRAFLHAQTDSRRFRLLLPEFSGSVTLAATTPGQSLSYRGSTFAKRDSQAASHVQALLDQVVDPANVVLEPAYSAVGKQDVTFLFGSRSNVATEDILRHVDPALLHFEFGAEWAIHCNGRRFSSPDPSTIDPGVYAASDDYGVIARLRSAGGPPVFIIAGLGGRATEGCGLYFKQHWRELDSVAPEVDFAVVLRFGAPFEASRVERVASSSS